MHPASNGLDNILLLVLKMAERATAVYSALLSCEEK
jgi:hypothetical protein